MSKTLTRLIDWLLAASLILALIAHGYIGSYSRYMADDYSLSATVRTHGLLGAQSYWYQAWTGRFSFTFVASLLGLLGPATPLFIPGLLLAMWFAATVWATHGIHSVLGRTSWARILLFAALLIFATLETAPNVVQSLYWQSGALTYVAPLIPLSLFVGVIGRFINEERKHFSYWSSLCCAGILTFVAGGFSDAYVVLQSCALILSILAVEIFAKQDFKSRIRPFLLVGLVGSLVALIIVAVAPGNGNRQAYFPRQFGGWDILGLTIFYSVRFIAKLVLTHPIIFLVSLFVPLLMGLRDFNQSKQSWDRRSCFRLLLITPAAVFLLIMCCTAPSVYAMSVMLPERAQILLSLIFVCGTLVWGIAAGELLARESLAIRRNTRDIVSLAATVALFLLILSPLISFFSTLGIRERARSYAADWDKQDLELRTAKQNGVGDVAVQQIGDFQWRIGKRPSDLHLRTDPAFWINRATATYYRLRSVRASEDVGDF